MLRGDRDAINAYTESLEETRRMVKDLESKQRTALESDEVTDENRKLIEYEISKVESRLRRMEKAMDELDRKREDLIEKLYE